MKGCRKILYIVLPKFGSAGAKRIFDSFRTHFFIVNGVFAQFVPPNVFRDFAPCSKRRVLQPFSLYRYLVFGREAEIISRCTHGAGFFFACYGHAVEFFFGRRLFPPKRADAYGGFFLRNLLKRVFFGNSFLSKLASWFAFFLPIVPPISRLFFSRFLFFLLFFCRRRRKISRDSTVK